MGDRWGACIILASLLAAGRAGAECTVSSDPGAAVRPLDPAVKADGALIVSMAMLPKLMHIDYAGAGKRPGCDLGPLTPGSDGYELWGDDLAGGQRKALPTRKGDPIVLVVPVVDLLKAIEASNAGKTAPQEGYLLATVTQQDFTGWRFYIAMPDQAMLRHDMAEALAGRASAIFRNTQGTTNIFVHKG